MALLKDVFALCFHEKDVFKNPGSACVKTTNVSSLFTSDIVEIFNQWAL